MVPLVCTPLVNELHGVANITIIRFISVYKTFYFFVGNHLGSSPSDKIQLGAYSACLKLLHRPGDFPDNNPFWNDVPLGGLRRPRPRNCQGVKNCSKSLSRSLQGEKHALSWVAPHRLIQLVPSLLSREKPQILEARTLHINESFASVCVHRM